MNEFWPVLVDFVRKARAGSQPTVAGEDVPSIPQLKVIFDGFGEGDDDDEDRDLEFYAVLIHRDAASDGFVYPIHENGWRLLVHRSIDEVCINLAYDVVDDRWHFNDPVNEGEIAYEDILISLHGRLG